jgi:amino acid adenylation domain-containing protein
LAKLTSLSQSEGVTLFMTMLAGLQTLLGAYSGQSDIVVGSPIAGRNNTEVEPLIGFFVNTLALRTELSGNPTFRELLGRVKESTLEAYAHQDIPFERLVEELQPERSLNYHPIFQVLFALQNAPQRALELAGLTLERLPLHQGTSAFDMSWFATHLADGMQIRIEYNTDIFDAATIKRALGHFSNLLEAIVSNPERRLSELELLDEQERRCVLEVFNDTGMEFRDVCLHQLFCEQAQRTPNATAIIEGNERLSFAELDRRSNRLANELIERGVVPDTLVGIYFERSAEMLVALLGVLKAGGAYVPLDPNYPTARLSAIIEDSHPKIILSHGAVAGDLPSETRWMMLAEADHQSEAAPEVSVESHHLAYVLFTSGSTGRPKGVAIEHKSAATFIQWALTAFTPEQLSGVLFGTSICFDLSIFEMFAPLACGTKIVLAENALELPSLEARSEVTLINTVPSAIAELVRSQSVPDSVRTVNLAGEALSPDLVEKIYGGTSVEKVFNLYGPTEDTTYSTYTLVPRGSAVLIGRPIANTQALILDRELQLRPIGVPGELFLAGAGLARGYLNRPDLTAERFLANPFVSGTRMYKTGDLCRWLADGNIEYLGRLDQQVKIRGFRIEPSEIEIALRNHPDVLDCVVVAREDVPGDKRLIAYLVPRDSATLQPASLRSALKSTLPDYMVPAAFHQMAQFPLTPNGKVDRKALPAPDQSGIDNAASYIAPRTETEQQLADIWSEVLRIERVGVSDNFFALGGHSLLATQVISRIRRDMNTELPLRSIFETPTIEGLARRIAGTAKSLQLASIQRVPRNRPLPLSFAQERLWFLDQLEPGNPQYNAPLPMRLKGPLDAAAMGSAINEIIKRHEVLRTTFHLDEDRPVQGITAELTIDVPVIDISDVPADSREKEAMRLAIEEARRPFNLSAGPVVRASLLRLDVTDHILLLDIHHIATDGWSIWPFIQELGALYEACRTNLPSPLPELPIQYADFAVWQREWIESDLIAGQLAYWKKQLAGAPDRIDLPTDRPRPAVQRYRGATETVWFSTELLKGLHSLGQSEGVTLYMTLLAAYQSLLYRYTGQEKIVVGSPIANRTRAEIEDLIGFFVNTLVMHSDLSGNPTFRELLQRVRAVALGAFANQDLPFEKLVEAIAPDRDLSSNPLVQVLFVMQNARRSVLRIAGVEFAGMPIHNETTKFDIGIFLLETPEGLSCMAEYSTDLFDASTIRRMLGHFGTLLEAIVKNPDQHIGELPLLAPEERQLVEAASSGEVVEYARERSLHEFIEEQVERTPDAAALVFQSVTLSYRELNERANRLAHRLRAMGVGPDVLVGVCIERSVEMVVGLLGIMKAGGAYVPLDPEYPRERLGLMLADAEAPVVLTTEHLLNVLPEHDVPTICLDRDWDTLAGEPTANPELITNGKNLAYVIYTSGSTGNPKGVPNVHEGIVNRLLWMQNAYGLTSADRVLQKTPYSFDVSVWEFFWPLMTGACLVVAQPGGHKDPDYLVGLITKEMITTLHFVPSMLRIFVEAEGVERCSSLRRVICSGEALPLDLQQRFFERLGAELHNLYGPTEASVDVTYWQCTPDSGRTTVPIGRPIWNTQIRILDRFLQLVPFGIPGELHIGGVGLARGYLKRPELTAEKFIPDGFNHEAGARLYKSGDLARMLPDGTIEYLGRIDHQVKIRGFRIELGEIEGTLASHPGVRESVVVAREDEPGDKRLVAYIVPDSDYQGADQQENADSLSAERVAQWVATFDEAYRQGGDIADSAFNITGWDSSYTDEPIPAAEMKVWVQSTVNRILALKPDRVWEIGCGTGLLLFNVAPHSKRYFGTDVSNTALSYLEQQLKRPELELPQVGLARRPAHEFEGTRGNFDAVVVNSVAQYFPDLDYFIEVLTGAIEAAGPNGYVFIGDLRSLPLLETFQTSVQMFRAADSTTVAELRQLVKQNIAQEGELLIDSEFFHAVRQRIPGIKRVEIQLKRGREHNELTQFRYDVTLHLGATMAERVDCVQVDWQEQQFSLNLLRETLRTTQPEMLRVTGVPNARLRHDCVERDVLMSESGPQTVEEARELVILLVRAEHGMEPEDFWMLEAEAPYRVEISASRTEVDGCFDVILRRVAENGETLFAEVRHPGELLGFKPLRSYANNPLRQRVAGQLVPQLRLWLSTKLPEYMVPQAFVVLDEFPLSTNGKVERKALPAPDQSGLGSTGSYVAPQTPTQEMLASIVAEVLRLERVGLHDNFFEMGGHSLSATQVVARARGMFGVELSVRVLFEAPTVAELAQAIERLERGKYQLETPPMVRADRSNPLPLSFAQQRLWFQYQLDPDSPLYNIPWATRMTGLLNPSALETALKGIVQRHDILRTTYAMEHDLPVQKVRPNAAVTMEIRDLTSLATPDREKEARRIVQEESAKPFDLTTDVLFRPMLLKLDEREHVLFVNTHHIACDGWSLGVMASDLAALYEAVLAGETLEEGPPSTLGDLPIQYADFAVWQRNWLQGDVLERQLTYWKQRLAGAPPVLALPSDRPRTDEASLRGATERVPIEKSLAEQIGLLSRQQGVSSFMTMLAAFQSLILYYTKQPDVVLGTDLAGRTCVETEALIGFFVNLIVLRTDLSRDPTFSELLGRVREVTLGAYAHQDLPFDTLVKELQPERSMSHNPLVQVLFVHVNTPRSRRTLPGIELNGFQFELPSKFDLAVFCSENDQGLTGTWNYNADLFDRRTILRTAAQFETVLEQVTRNPDLRLSEIQQILETNEQLQQTEEYSALQETSAQKLKGIKRRPAGALVKTP